MKTLLEMPGTLSSRASQVNSDSAGEIVSFPEFFKGTGGFFFFLFGLSYFD